MPRAIRPARRAWSSSCADPAVMRAATSLALTGSSAVVFGLAFPPTSWQPLAWVALVPFFVALSNADLRGRLLLGWLWAVLFAWAVGDWMPGSIATYYRQPLALGVGFFLGVSTLMVAPYVMAFASLYRPLARAAPTLAPLLVAAAWAACELGRGRLFTGSPVFIGNPWGLSGYSQTGTPIAQIADLTGVYGIGFTLAAVNASLAQLWVAARQRPIELRPRLAGLGVSLVPALLALAYGHLVLRADAAREADASVAVAVVQANIDLGTQWRSDLYGKNLDRYLRLTARALAEQPASIVFWPEAAMTFFVEEMPVYRAAISNLLGPGGTELVAGGPRAEHGSEPRYYNSAWRISPSGEVLAHYDKEYLVPFAEYFPLRRFDFLRRRFSRVRVFEHGTSQPLLPTRAGPAGVLICNEAMLPEVVSARVSQGASYLANPTNDTWISAPKYTEQQLLIASMRAIEQRRYLVRASTAGPSAVVDPFGRVIARAPALEPAWIHARIAARSDRTVYNRIGDLFGFACAASVAAALLRGRASRRRAEEGSA